MAHSGAVMRTLILSLLARGGVASAAMLIVLPAGAQDSDKKDPAQKSVTLSESAGTRAAAPVVQVKNQAPPVAPPAGAAAAPGTAATPGAPRSTAGGAGMTYGRYGGAATDTDGEWRFRYNGYFRAPMN